MSKTKSQRHAQKKKFVVRPTVDALTVAWITMLSTTLMCELGSVAARLYVAFVEPRANLLRMFAAYLLVAAAIVGILLLVTTPIVVKRKRSNPPMPLVIFAFVVGAVPWLAMLTQLSE
ncbi:MAG: hypothetical protein K8U03_11245 [Planctomycetia bacterium]|nr:hypothetical protein [Planctomycetia bacterium]